MNFYLLKAYILERTQSVRKTKGVFPNENSLSKLLYVGIQNAYKKLIMPIRNCGHLLFLSWQYCLRTDYMNL